MAALLPRKDFLPALFAIAAGLTAAAALFLAVDPLTINRGWGKLIAAEALLVVLLAFGPVVIRMRRSEHPDPLEPVAVFAVVYTLVFAVRPVFLLSPWAIYIDQIPGEVYRNLGVSNASIALAMLYGIAGLIAFHLGYRTLSESSERRWQVAPAPIRWSSSRVSHVMIVALVMAGISAMLIFPVLGGLGRLVSEFGRVRALLTGYGYQGLGLDLLVVLIVLLWVDHLYGRRRPIVLPLLIFSNIYNMVLGSRAGVFNLWILLFLAHRYMSGKRFSRRQLMAGTALVLVAVFFAISLGEVRNRGYSEFSEITDVVRDFWSEASLGLLTARVMLEFNQVDIFATVLEIGPPTFPFLYGQSYLELIYQPVPRALWPDKPWPYDVHIGWVVQGVYSGIPPSVVGEFYLNFHIAGVLLGMFALGAACRFAYQRLLALPLDPSKVLIYAILLTFLPVVMTRAFVAAFTTLLIFGIPALVAVWYIRSEERLSRR